MTYRNYRGLRAEPIWVIIFINFLVFVASLINRNLVIFGLGLQPISLNAHPWTILTSMFVHAGFSHIFFNMITLYFFGTYLTRLVGENKFLIVYFGGGILGSIFFILMPPSPFSIAVGASGAIFALGGALAAMRPKTPVMLLLIPVPIPLWIAVIGGFVILSFIPGIAWQAHLGGLMFGLALGYFFKKRERYYYLR